MKTEQEKRTRGRPRKSATLSVDGKLMPPPDALRKMRQISRDTRIPLEQVYEDALSNGIVTLPEMYSSIIKFRKEREKLYESQFNDDVVPESDLGESEHESDREADGHLDPEFCDAPGSETPDEEGSEGIDHELPGEDEEDVEVSSYGI